MRSNRRPLPPPPLSRQKGIVLVVGLVFLLVLTIIGVTSLRTTTLEQRMAGNLQQRTMAFQDTETKITMLLNNLNSGQTTLSTNDNCSSIDADPDPDAVNKGISASHTCSAYVGNSDPGRLTDTAEGEKVNLLHFRLESQSTTLGNASVTLQQGVYQRGPGSPAILEE